MARESVDLPEAKALGRALSILRKRAGLSQEGAGDRYGISGEGWRKYEAGMAKSIFSPDTQHRLTSAVKATRDDLLAERARAAGDDLPGPSKATAPSIWALDRCGDLSLLPIRDTIQAGAWLMADDLAQAQPTTHPVARDPRFPQAQQWLSLVRGDSVNQLNIADGDLVHCIDAGEIGYYARTGDIVEVERLRFDGQERELTLKQVEVTSSGIVLWSRSTNPRWRTPVHLNEVSKSAEKFEIRIIALVVASIRRF